MLNLRMNRLSRAQCREGEPSLRHLIPALCVLGAVLLLPYTEASADDASSAAVSPKKPWGEFEVVEEPEPRPLIDRILLWVPNRILDFIDIFRLDVGAGMATGGVVRVSKYVQAGFRSVHPASLRVGAFGRRAPFLLEHSSEFGISPFYVSSSDRQVCPGEVGAGLDVVVVGAYAGVCVEEVADFLGGLFFLDIRDDDLR